MLFKHPLQPAVLLRRYKRFLADVELPDGGTLTVHCPNTGSMMGCSAPGAPVMISRSDNPKRKYPHTLEMVTSDSWEFPYSRKQAAFPLSYVGENKFWPAVRRVDDAYGDRNLICSCEPIEAYAELEH